MKPFQALYFVRHNLTKALTVYIMIALTGLLYVGGSYLSNIEVSYLKTLESEEDVVYVNLNGVSTELGKDALLEEIYGDEKLHMFAVGGNDFIFPTVLGFTNGNFAFSYTKEDFLWRNERMGWIKDTSLVQENTLFITKCYAKYLGLQDGDLLTESRKELIFYYGEHPYTIRIMDGEAMGAILIAQDSVINEFYQLTFSDKGSKEYLERYAVELKEKYPSITIGTHEERVEEVKRQLAFNGIIFPCIIAVVTCVFFITINAVLVGIYDKRKSEFQIYESIGIPRKKIRQKVVNELVIMSGVGMVLGLVLAFVAITLLNVCIFAKDGLHLYYYHPWALGSWLICNAMILIPSILLRLRAIDKSSGEV